MADATDPRDDAELLERTGSDPDAFAVFYRRHVDAVLAYFAVRVRDPEAAADLMAETFAAALASARRYRRREAPAAAWLFAIARNKLTDSIRRGRVENAARWRLGFEPLALDDDDIQRVTELVDAAREPRATAFLERLPADQRDAVRARVLDERDYEDIAHELRCSKWVVRQRVSRGLRALRTGMEEA